MKRANEAQASDYYSGTCSSTQKLIEGYMLKEIENKKMFHEDVFHLRFFRVVFG